MRISPSSLILGTVIPTITAFVPPALAATQTESWLTSPHPIERRAHKSPGDRVFVAYSVPNTVTNLVTHRLQTSIALTKAQAVLEGYARLKDGWDGEESVAPSRESLTLARQLLAHLPGGVSVPHPMVNSRGVIGFYWSNANAFADIEIDQNGTFSIFTKKRGLETVENFGDDLAINGGSTKILDGFLKPLGRI